MSLSHFIPILLLLPSTTIVALFSDSRSKALYLVAALGFVGLVIGTMFGWFGTLTFVMVEQALRGSTSSIDLAQTKAHGIFVSWAASLPFGYLFSRHIERFRRADPASRALGTFVLFYGVHVAAACFLLLIQPWLD